jgi:hypothetical protein
VKGNWALIDNPRGENPECLPGAPAGFYPIRAAELYDLAADPGETRNMAEADPRRVAELRRLIQARFAAVPRRGGRQEIPEDLKDELRALGYVAN